MSLSDKLLPSGVRKIIGRANLQKKEIWIWIILGILVFAGLVRAGTVRLDPDFGWHIRMGEYILANGIPSTDPLSYTMANYPFVDHEWLTNIIMVYIYRLSGMAGLSFVAAIIVMLTGFAAVSRQNWKWLPLPMLMALSSWWPRAGIRPQIIDWFFMAVFIRITGYDKSWDRWKWVLPPLMLIWANLHGGFALGLAVAGMIVIARSIRNKTWAAGDLWVLVLTAAATFANPYGHRLWGEVFQQMSDANLRKMISEWQPFFSQAELGWSMLVAWAGAFIWYYRKEIDLWKAALVVGTFIAGILSLRHNALFAVAVVAVVPELMDKFYIEMSSRGIPSEKLTKAFNFMGIIALANFLLVALPGLLFPQIEMREDIWYPKKAVNWLNSRGELRGNIYADYSWGGYLDWKMPGTRVFIDGRMPSWKWKSPDPLYSDYAFDEYLDIASRGKWEKWFDKYNVRTLLLPREKPAGGLDYLVERALKKTGLLKDKRMSPAEIYKKLASEGWEKVYEDEVAMVYERP